ncbi:MAG TPA: 50S ribosomal protein L25/general stress protein Ctc [Bacteroidia bacterium]|nr:50S ribosomal protein L25/general stress protein Ctc [Bacteroidia bacterium]
MKTVSLSGSPRANVGKTDASALRAQGQVPCVIYGAGEQIHFSADERHFKDIIYTPETKIVNVEIGGKSYKTVLQEAQFHRITDKLIHADFLQVTENKPVAVFLPVKTNGTAEGVKAGGRLVVKMRKLKAKGLISQLPQHIELNVEKLEIGKSIATGDINIEGISILHPKNLTVVSVQTQRNAAAEEAATPAAGTTAAAAPTAAPAAAPAAGAKPAAPAKK